MADEKDTQNVEETQTEEVKEEKTEKVEEKPQKEENTFTQDQVNDIVEKRLAKERKKYEGFAEYKENAEKYEELDKKFSKASAELEQMKHDKQIADWKESVSKETGVSASILRGETEEEIKEHAKAIKDTISYPQVEQGQNPNGDGVKSSPEGRVIEALERGNLL